ncbi:hypothetical protein Clacol_006319 [Clathrus columnatus]|uniref:Uncharacterized protein n=1 Tax=Clathrus columnatus TaxID=1419009 RepID=A0AAV5AEX5_9AGAM|nr:hypothetical protein Clacol_006319 [Clathrus columnatus]
MQSGRRYNVALTTKTRCFIRRSNCRTFFGRFKKDKTTGVNEDNLFFPLSSSPFPELRARAQTIKRICRCPVCITEAKEISSKKADEPPRHKPLGFECPSCGYPTHCSREHWEADSEHGKYCSKLKEVNEDEHDLRGPREKSEYYLPGAQPYEEAISFSNWDMFWYTRGFRSMDTERMRRNASKLLTYPLTIGSVLHRHSYITTRNQRLTSEGVRSLTALRSTVHVPIGGPETRGGSINKPPTRIFVLGARGESALPPHVWGQLCYLFPAAIFQIYFIGPQVALPKESTRSMKLEEEEEEVPAPNSETTATELYGPPTPSYIGTSTSKYRLKSLTVSSGIPSYTLPHTPLLSLTALRTLYTQPIHDELGPFDPYTDVFVLFAPGLGYKSPTVPNKLQITSPNEWGGVIPLLLSTRCVILGTAYSPVDVERDIQAIETTDGVAGEFDWIITPGKNEFGSERWEVADFDVRAMVKINWALWAIRGKTREVQEKKTFLQILGY